MFQIIAREWAADLLEWLGNHLMDAAMDPILPDGWLGDNPRDVRCFVAVAVGGVAGLCFRGSKFLDG